MNRQLPEDSYHLVTSIRRSLLSMHLLTPFRSTGNNRHHYLFFKCHQLASSILHFNRFFDNYVLLILYSTLPAG